ncbi:hypothetical protein AWB81_00824 [Caballeronia arationis]|nr:hypothetical protein AWB81_00824 [Caballeronia arationis]
MTQSDSARSRPIEQSAFDEWPPELRSLFDGTSIETKGGFTASLLAVDEAGRVRTSLLSLGELARGAGDRLNGSRDAHIRLRRSVLSGSTGGAPGAAR